MYRYLRCASVQSAYQVCWSRFAWYFKL